MGKERKTTRHPYVFEWDQNDWDGPYYNPHSDEVEPQWGPVEIKVYRLDPESGDSIGPHIMKIELRKRTEIDSILTALFKVGGNSPMFNEREALGLLLSEMCKDELIKMEDGLDFKKHYDETDAAKFSENATNELLSRPIPLRKGITYTTVPPGIFVYEETYAWIEYDELTEMEYAAALEETALERTSGRKLSIAFTTSAASQLSKSKHIKNADFSSATVSDKSIKLTPKFARIAEYLLKKGLVNPPGLHEDKILVDLNLETKGSGEKKRIATLERPKVNGKNLPNPALNTVILKGDNACYYLNPAAIFRRKK